MPQAGTGAPTTNTVAETGTEALTSADNGNATALRTSNTQPFEPGIQQFLSGSPEPSNSTLSLAEIVAKLKAQRHQNPRSFNNDSIAQLHAAGIQSGNLDAQPNVAASKSPTPAPAPTDTNSEPTGTLMAQNERPELPQGDQPLSPASPTAAQQKHRASDETSGTASAETQAAAPGKTAQSESAPATQKLPQSSSSLPLFLLLGVAGVAGGAVYSLRR